MDEVLFEVRGQAGIVRLNRPKALNALTINMVHLIDKQLHAWATDERVALVVIMGEGEKAFCAGGDIRALHDWGRAQDPRVIGFYADEYRLNTFIKEYPKPYISIMDGINMGGGVGLSVHGSRRIGTERLTFAMPETGIGLFPDVGGTFFLPRCPGELGLYLGLTGARLKAADALYCGIVDDYVASADVDGLVDALARGVPVDEAVKAAASDAGRAPLSAHRGEIDQHFCADGVPGLLAGLEAAGEWGVGVAKIIEAKSPLSSFVAFRQIREGARLSFRECMQLEFRLTNRFMAAPDFYEGVRAVVIDKDQTPKWTPARFEDVTAAQVDAYFAPLGEGDLNFEQGVTSS